MTPQMLSKEEGDVVGLLQRAQTALDSHPESSVELAEAAERLAEEQGDGLALVQCLRMQGLGWLRRSGWNEARVCFEAALGWARQSGDALGEAQCLQDLGTTALRQREIPAALEWLFQAQEKRQAAGDSAGEARTLSLIGSAYGAAGRFVEAGEALARALTLARAHGDAPAELGALGNAAMLFESSEDLPQALARYKETLEEAYRQSHAIYIAQTHAALCRVLGRLGRPDEALAHGQEAIARADATASPHQRVIARRALGKALSESGSLREAQHWLEEALALAEGEHMRSEWTDLLHELGCLYQRRDEPALARQFFEAALIQAIENGSVADQAREHRELASLCESEGDLTGAVRHLKALVEAEEQTRRERARTDFLTAMARLEWERAHGA